MVFLDENNRPFQGVPYVVKSKHSDWCNGVFFKNIPVSQEQRFCNGYESGYF